MHAPDRLTSVCSPGSWGREESSLRGTCMHLFSRQMVKKYLCIERRQLPRMNCCLTWYSSEESMASRDGGNSAASQALGTKPTWNLGAKVVSWN